DADWPRLTPLLLGNVHPSDRLMTISLRSQPFVQVPQIALQVLSVLLLRDAVHPDRRRPRVTVDIPRPTVPRRSGGRASETGLRAPVSLSPLPSGVPLTCPATSMRRSCCPPKVHTNTDRPCSLGSGCLPFPEVIALIRPSDSLHCFAPELRFPSLGPTCTRMTLAQDRQGLPDDWSTLLSTRRGRTSRRLPRSLDLTCGSDAAVFGLYD